MKLSQSWDFTEKLVNRERDSGAVYQLADDLGTIIYIGSSNALLQRLKEHLGEDAKSCIKTNAKKYQRDYREDYAAEELRLYDVFVRMNGQQPKCNTVRPCGQSSSSFRFASWAPTI